MGRVISLFFLFGLVLSCTEKNKTQPVSFAPKTVEAKGRLINPDSVEKPKSISAVIPAPIKAGLPKVNLTNLNVHLAGIPKIFIVNTDSLKRASPGSDTFLLPKTVPAKGKARIAGMPVVVVAKDAAAKDINPANFSFYKALQGLKNNTVRCILEDKA